MPGHGLTHKTTTFPNTRWLRRLVPLLLALVWSSASAVTVEGLYAVEVPVAGSGQSQLEAGAREGLKQVLLRVSGHSSILQREELAPVLEQSESLLQTYQFLRGGGRGYRLRMTFGAVGVNQALSSIDAPVWGANRPLALAWVAVQQGASRELVTQPRVNDDGEVASDGRWYRAFQAAAARRGLPLAFPPEAWAGDRELLSEVWGQFLGELRSASEDLSHDLLASVRISRSGSGWQGAWVLDGRGLEESNRAIQAGSPEALAERMVGHWADLLASRYAVAAGEIADSPQVDIVLDNVERMTDYAAAKAALDGLTPVLKVGPVRVTPTRVVLRVAFSGELAQLREYMALDPRFVSEEATVMAAEDNAAEGIAATDDVAQTAGGQPTATAGGDVDGQAAAGEGDVAPPVFRYQSSALNPEDSEQAFESLYPILHYRWQRAPSAGGDAGQP